MATNTTVSYFETLPGELRNEIYRYLLDPTCNKDESKPRSDLLIDPLSESGISITNSFAIHTSILQLNKNIYKEAQAYLYEHLGPVVTVKTNFFPYLYKRLYKNEYLAWRADGDSWEAVQGREAHLEIMWEDVDIYAWNGDTGMGTLVLLGMHEINEFAKWVHVSQLDRQITYTGLRLTWTFNDDRRSILARPHRLDHRTFAIRKSILEPFANLHQLNVIHAVNNPAEEEYVTTYLTQSNCPISWNRSEVFRAIELLQSFESKIFLLFTSGDLEGTVQKYEQLSPLFLEHVAWGSVYVAGFLEYQAAPDTDPEPWQTLYRLRYIMLHNYILAQLMLVKARTGGISMINGLSRLYGRKRKRIDFFVDAIVTELFDYTKEPEVIDRGLQLQYTLLAFFNFYRAVGSHERNAIGRHLFDTTPPSRLQSMRDLFENTFSRISRYTRDDSRLDPGEEKLLLSYLPTTPLRVNLSRSVKPSFIIKRERDLLTRLSYKQSLYESLLPQYNAPPSPITSPITPTPQSNFAFSFPQNALLIDTGGIPMNAQDFPIYRNQENKIRAANTRDFFQLAKRLEDTNQVIVVHLDRVEYRNRPLMESTIGWNEEEALWKLQYEELNLDPDADNDVEVDDEGE